MTFDEWKVLAKGIKSVYTREQFLPDGDALKIWYQLLQDIDYKVLQTAILKYMQTNKFPPTIAELRQLCAEIVQGERKDWGAAWETVIRSIQNFGMYRELEALDSMDDLTRRCVRRLGYRNICMSENITADRANFRLMYEQMQERDKADSQLSLNVKQRMQELLAQHEQAQIAQKEMK